MADLAPRSVFDGLLKPLGSGGGVAVRERPHPGLATIMGTNPTPLAARLGFPFPSGQRRTAGPAFDLLGISRNTWLAVGEGGPTLAATLTTQLAGLAQVADQSGAYGLLDLSGPRAADTLAKGLNIDLDPSAFPDNAVAVSQAAHLGVILWRTTTGFGVLTPRSSAGSFWHFLST